MKPIAMAFSALAVVIASGCTIAHAGPKNIDELEVAIAPAGSLVELRLGEGTVIGELIEVTAEHVMLKTSAAIVVAPYASLEVFKPANLPATRTGRRVPSDAVIAAWLPLARFPAGIQPEHLAALLAAYAQAEPRVLK